MVKTLNEKNMSNLTSSNFNLTQPLPNLLPINFLLTTYNFSTLFSNDTAIPSEFEPPFDEIRDKSSDSKSLDKFNPFNPKNNNKLSLFTALALSKIPSLPLNFSVFFISDLNALLDNWLLDHPEKETVYRIIKRCIENQEKNLNLSGQNLKILDNKLIEILSHLTWVTTLRLTANQLKDIPAHAFKRMRQLTTLWLNHNQLTQLPPDLFHSSVNLNTISLSQNQLTQISVSTFGQLEQLNNLFLDQNHLIDLHPQLFSSLTNLSNLNLSHNNLETLPETIFSNLNQLFFLFLEENPFTHLPPGIFNQLAENAVVHLNGNFDSSFNFKLPSHLQIFMGGYATKRGPS